MLDEDFSLKYKRHPWRGRKLYKRRLKKENRPWKINDREFRLDQITNLAETKKGIKWEELQMKSQKTSITWLKMIYYKEYTYL